MTGSPPRARLRALARALALVAAVVAVCGAQGRAPAGALGLPERVAPGVDLYRLDDPALIQPPGPIAVQALRLDPGRVTIRTALALDRVLGTETVAATARRHGAVAAINAGFFLPNGDPAGLLKVAGDLVSEAASLRGAVGIRAAQGARRVSLLFDRVQVTLRVRAGGRMVPADGIDTSRPPGRLVWFTPRFFDHDDTTDAGVDWIVRGTPPAVIERRDAAMRTTIPPDGAVLSYGGSAPPPPLDNLRPGDAVALTPVYVTALGTPAAAWSAAPDSVGGAGLLVWRGRAITDWTAETLRAGFATERHPRTMVGVDGGGRIWLVTIDGRNPRLSLGMSFVEMQGLARRLGLREALNLDGGGSTTMVVGNGVVNHPSDAAGPRKVSDALLVFASPR